MVKKRVAPSRNPAPTTAIASDPFFSTNKNANKKTGKPSTSRDKFIGKEKIHNKKEFKKPELDPRSKNIKKAKNVRNEVNKFNFKNKDGTHPTKYNQNKTKIKKNKIMPQIENKRQEKFKQIEEDSEYKMQAKNICRAIVKHEGKEDKKGFDKKKWRLQKYSKKYKLEQFEEKRKKAVIREYYQQVKGESPKINVNKIYEQYDSDEETRPRKNYVQHPDYKPPGKTQKSNKTSTKRKVQLELERLKQEKEDKKKELLRKKQEKEEALKVYQQKKNEKQQQLHKKTKKGQPVMKGRIEMLLEKIQNG